MMKKTVAMIGITILLIAVGIIVFFCFKQPTVGEFALSEVLSKYEWEIKEYPTDKNVGEVNTPQVAIEKAKELWLEEYRTVGGKPYDPIKGRKILVSYDSANECWHLTVKIPRNVIGVFPHALIQKDGTVLAVWLG